MNRLHVHVAVADLDQSIAFYRTLFGTAPSVVEPDYAKWMLDDPRVNFAISSRGRKVGLDHLGIQVESDDELAAVAGRLRASGERTVAEQGARCCYATGNKAWVADPAGILWETFHTTGSATVYGEDNADADALQDLRGGSPSSCCAPAIDAAPRGGGCCG